MAHDHHHAGAVATECHSCECQPFLRNAYWTGKLMLARDFVDEQRYLVDKLRHHNQHLHGAGVVCGLKVVQHDVEECRKYFVCIEPGTAIDCCGHDIIVCERECIDLRTFPPIKKLFDDRDETPRLLQVCIRYRECPTEDIPVLYDECGCDDARCAPNRILESYEIFVEILERPPEPPHFPENCCDLWAKGVDKCPHCDQPDCVRLATIPDFVAGQPIVDKAPPAGDAAVIDNITFRPILPSVQAIKEFLDCLKLCEPGGGGHGGEGPPGKGIDAVDATFVPCTQPGTAAIDESGPLRTLVLEIPRGCDGAPGSNGVGLEADLTQIKALSWRHNKPSELAVIDMGPGQPHQLGVVIAFTKPVQAATVDADHVFQVLLAREERFERLRLKCRCAVDEGTVIAVEQLQMNGDVIVGATVSTSATPDAVAFIFNQPEELIRELLRRQELWIVLRCDFIIDANGKAVDGEHARATLLSGDRPAPPDPAAKFGVQGGLFESWFVFQQG